MKSVSRVLVGCALFASITVLSVVPAQAQVQCNAAGDTCSNSGTVGDNAVIQPTANSGGNASFTNSGTFGNNAVIQATVNGGHGDASITNTGTFGNAAVLQATSNVSGNATITNSGTFGNNAVLQANANNGNASITTSGTFGNAAVLQATGGGAGSASLTNSGTMGNNAVLQSNTSNGDATTTNTGTIGGSGVLQSLASGSGNATTTNTGTLGSFTIIDAQASGNGNATAINSGTAANTFEAVTLGNGTATAVNSGTILGSAGILEAFAGGNGNAAGINSGTMGAGTFVEVTTNGSGSATFANSGTIGPNAVVEVSANGTGNATFSNSGIAIGTVVVQAAHGIADLTNTAGSLIVGSIQLSGPNKVLEFVGGNYIYTLQSLAGVQINAHGAPFVVAGNTVAVLDPTGFALADRSVTNFAGGISSLLQDRFTGMGIAGAGAGSAMMPMGFAPETGLDRISAAHDAFVGMPSVSMSYASDDSKARNALAMYTKAPAPAVPVNDITVWTSGFGGERHQSAFDDIQRARDDAFGAAIGVDRQFTPDLRLGVFAGGGSSRLRTDFNVQNVDSDYGFAGAYGRFDRRAWYLDFALFGGGISSKETRQVANNLVGFETATASYNGWFISPDVTAGYRVFTDWGVVTPKARLRYVGGTLDGYTETGSAQGLSVGARNFNDVEERLGVELSTIRPVGLLPGTMKLTGEVDAVGLQRLGDDTINAVLLAQNLAFTTPGKAQAFGGAASAMIEWRPKNNVALYVSAEGMLMDDHSSSWVGKGGVRVGF